MPRLPIDSPYLSRSVPRHLDKAAAAGGLLALAATMAAILWLLIVEQRGSSERFTEFYIVGAGGMAEGYPTGLTVGEEGFVTVGIVNQEGQATAYAISLLINGAAVAQVGPVRVSPRERWEQPMGFTLRRAGERQLVEFALYMEGRSLPYRTLRLWVDGRPAVVAAGTEAGPAPEEPIAAHAASSPGAPAPEPPVVPVPGPEATPAPGPQFAEHIVSRGENLTVISRVYGVPLKTVIEANASEVPDPNLIYPNQRILIPLEGR